MPLKGFLFSAGGRRRLTMDLATPLEDVFVEDMTVRVCGAVAGAGASVHPVCVEDMTLRVGGVGAGAGAGVHPVCVEDMKVRVGGAGAGAGALVHPKFVEGMRCGWRGWGLEGPREGCWPEGVRARQ